MAASVFVLGMVAACILSIVAPLGLAPLLGALGLFALVWSWRERRLAELPALVPVLPILTVIWAATSLAWAPQPAEALQSILRLMILVVAGIVVVDAAERLSPGWRRRHTVIVAAAVVVAAGLMAAEYLTAHAPSIALAHWRGGEIPLASAKSEMNRGAVFLAIIVWPAAVMAASRLGRGWAALILTAVAIAVAASDNLAAKLALAVSTLLFLAAWRLPRPTIGALRGGLAIVVLALPLAAQHVPTPPGSVTELPWLPMSAQHRLAIWNFVSARIVEHPLLGWGMESSRSIPGGGTIIDAERRDAEGRVVQSLSGELLPLHPHNAPLQWWLELGLPGALLMGAWVWQIAGRLRRIGDPAARAAATATMGGAALIALVSFGAWQNWWLAALWLAAALCTLAASFERKIP